MSHETTLFEFRFPDIGEGLTEGTIVELKVAPGSSVKQGEALAIVETDKVVTEMPSPVEGVVVELPITKGQVVQVGEIVARIRTGLHPAPIGGKLPRRRDCRGTAHGCIPRGHAGKRRRPFPEFSAGHEMERTTLLPRDRSALRWCARAKCAPPPWLASWQQTPESIWPGFTVRVPAAGF